MATKKDFKPLGGSSRNYVNTKTGEIISRYQYDKTYGATKEFKGNTHLKAKLNKEANPLVASARPAPGRKSALPKTGVKGSTKPRFSPLKPLKDKQYRHIQIPVTYKNGVIDNMKLEPIYSSTVDRIRRSILVFGASINITFALHGLLDTKNIFRLREKTDVPSWGEFSDQINNYYLDPLNYKVSGESFAELRILAIDFYVVFKGLAK